ncbi:MAG: BatD family protein [Prevotellaceae bacterium]|jgi:hypothetical protein|nr:BatD family protein [Prevotellaceae bacterium]
MIKRLNFIAIILFFALPSVAQKVEFTAKAPSAVVSEQSFQLQYIINSQEVKNLQLPKIADFDIIAGPSSFTSSSYQFINGKSTSSFTTTYTYVLLAKKEGTFTIPPATAVIDGTQHKSNALSIRVLPPDAQQPKQQNQQQSSSAQIDDDDIFILPLISKSTVREQEMTMLTYKIYHSGNLINIENVKLPDFKGFMIQDIDLDPNKVNGVENYKGRNYQTYILKQVLISPQNAGKIEISPLSLTGIVRVQRRVQNPRSFFDSFSTYQDIKKSLSSGRVTLNVTPLPTPKPADFSSAVGSLSMSSSISSTDVEANSSITLKITLKGSGNLKMIKTPNVIFPTDFETYEPKVINNLSTTSSGLSGTKTFEYLAIPRHSGNFTIPPVSLTYFDLAANSYKTLTTEQYTLNVAKGSGSQTAVAAYDAVEQEKVKQLATDVRYIKTGNLNIKPQTEIFTGTLNFYLFYIIPLLIAVLFGLIFHKKAKDNANIALMRNKKANKIAKKRLKKAEKNLKANQKDGFYDEILSALWLYISDKLNLPLSALNKENMSEELTKHSVSPEITDEFLSLLKNCEFERYAPIQDTHAAMDKIYSDSLKLIEKLENTIKK